VAYLTASRMLGRKERTAGTVYVLKMLHFWTEVGVAEVPKAAFIEASVVLPVGIHPGVTFMFLGLPSEDPE
jgi:hypothetical protein